MNKIDSFIQALICCTKSKQCEQCPYNGSNCIRHLEKDILKFLQSVKQIMEE